VPPSNRSLPAPNVLLAWLVNGPRRAALQGLAKYRAQQRNSPSTAMQPSPTLVRDLYYWALCEMLFGNLAPLRLYVIRTLQAPANSISGQHACSKDGCRIRDCQGNRLERNPCEYYSSREQHICYRPTPSNIGAWDLLGSAGATDGHVTAGAGPSGTRGSGAGTASSADALLHSRASASDDGSSLDSDGSDSELSTVSDRPSTSAHSYSFQTCRSSEPANDNGDMEEEAVSSEPFKLPKTRKLYIKVSHHKNDGRYKFPFVSFCLPHDLAFCIDNYLEIAHPIITLGQESNFLFPKLKTGAGMVDTDMTATWGDILGLYPAPWRRFPPSDLRDIYVVQRVEGVATLAALAGEDLRGDGAMMTNTPHQVWQDCYMKGHASETLVPPTLDRITRWRHQQWGALTATEDGSDYSEHTHSDEE
jgi:hypothetical protein